MSNNYAKTLARDAGNAPMQEYPAPFKAVASVYYRDNLPVSSVVTLDQATSSLEVGAFGGQGVVIRWVPISASPEVGNYFTSVISSGLGANFDHYIPPSTYRRFVVPKETQGSYTGQMGSVNGLFQRIGVSNAGATASSVLVTQY